MKNQPIISCSDALDGEDQKEEASRADTSWGWSGIHKDGQWEKSRPAKELITAIRSRYRKTRG